MPLATLKGVVTDHGLQIIQKTLMPRLWFVPNRGHVSPGGGAFAGVEHEARWLNLDAGSFEVDVYTEPSDPDIWYTMRLDWLIPGQDTEPPEKRARGNFEWPDRIYPDTGGNIGELPVTVGLGLVYVSDSVSEGMSPTPRYQLAYNPKTFWLYERTISW